MTSKNLLIMVLCNQTIMVKMLLINQKFHILYRLLKNVKYFGIPKQIITISFHSKGLYAPLGAILK